jgi:hypothetical protein
LKGTCENIMKKKEYCNLEGTKMHKQNWVGKIIEFIYCAFSG